MWEGVLTVPKIPHECALGNRVPLGAEVKPSGKAWAPQVLHCALLADCCAAAAGHAGEALPAPAPLWAR